MCKWCAYYYYYYCSVWLNQKSVNSDHWTPNYLNGRWKQRILISLGHTEALSVLFQFRVLDHIYWSTLFQLRVLDHKNWSTLFQFRVLDHFFHHLKNTNLQLPVQYPLVYPPLSFHLSPLKCSVARWTDCIPLLSFSVKIMELPFSAVGLLFVFCCMI